MADHSQVFSDFYAHADEEKARDMSAYMRDLFPYLGLPKPLRAKLQKDFLRTSRKEKVVDWNFVSACWDLEREFQYLAIDYLTRVLPLLTPEDIPRLRALAVEKSWWDTVDGLDHLIGDIALRYAEVKSTLLDWSKDENIWLRRIAIDHQMKYKDKTDTVLLEQIIVNNLEEKEFFIKKAIGWSLREYGKTNPNWVIDFVRRYEKRMSSLSMREALKRIQQ